jgi:hypothetical protein
MQQGMRALRLLSIVRTWTRPRCGRLPPSALQPAQAARARPALFRAVLCGRHTCRATRQPGALSGAGVRQDGGFWINLGPLLYHWADAHTYLPEDELSVEVRTAPAAVPPSAAG